MKDGRQNNGGARPGAGRKSKKEEQRIAELLSPLQSEWIKCVKGGLADEQGWAAKLWAEYMFGKAKETKDLNVNMEQPFFPLDDV